MLKKIPPGDFHNLVEGIARLAELHDPCPGLSNVFRMPLGGDIVLDLNQNRNTCATITSPSGDDKVDLPPGNALVWFKGRPIMSIKNEEVHVEESIHKGVDYINALIWKRYRQMEREGAQEK